MSVSGVVCVHLMIVCPAAMPDFKYGSGSSFGRPMIDPSKTLSVGEVARRSGVSAATVRFYEELGLIASSRTQGNQRRYTREVLRHIAIIKVAQRVGIPLEVIKRHLDKVPRGRPVTAPEWSEMTAAWRRELDERIERLIRLRDELSSCIGCGCLSLQDCPLRNPGDALGVDGAGPRILERGLSSASEEDA